MNNNGYIYCFSNVSMPGILKIGMTTRNPIMRLKEANISDTWRPPTQYILEFAKKVVYPKQKENTLHTLLSQYTERINPKREFFRVSVEEVKIFFELMDGEFWKEKEIKKEEEEYTECEYEEEDNNFLIHETDNKNIPISPIEIWLECMTFKNKDLYKIKMTASQIYESFTTWCCENGLNEIYKTNVIKLGIKISDLKIDGISESIKGRHNNYRVFDIVKLKKHFNIDYKNKDEEEDKYIDKKEEEEEYKYIDKEEEEYKYIDKEEEEYKYIDKEEEEYKYIDKEEEEEEYEEDDEEQIKIKNFHINQKGGCRDITKCFIDGQRIRHMIGNDKVWVCIYDALNNRFICENNNQYYKSLSGFAKMHYNFYNKCVSVNGWGECECEIDGEWVSTFDL